MVLLPLTHSATHPLNLPAEGKLFWAILDTIGFNPTRPRVGTINNNEFSPNYYNKY